MAKGFSGRRWVGEHIHYKSTKALLRAVLEYCENAAEEVLQLPELTDLPQHVMRLLLARELGVVELDSVFRRHLEGGLASCGELRCEWVYDFVKQTPQSELDALMETGKYDLPSKFSPEANQK